MRIALIGSHSTGKTTIFDLFKKNFYNNKSIYFIEEVARQAILNGHLLGKEATEEAYTYYFSKQLEEERIALSFPNVISDRCIIDTIGYNSTNIKKNLTLISPLYWKLMQEVFYSVMYYYDCYIFFPVEFGIHVDNVRPLDYNYQTEVSAEILRVLVENKLNYFVVSGSIDERFNKIIKEIRL